MLEKDLESEQVISWYPGHVKKGIVDLVKTLHNIDLIIDVRDARVASVLPNKQLDGLLKNKLRLIILNKADLADKEANKKWKMHYALQNIDSLIINSKDPTCRNLVINQISGIIFKERAKQNKASKRQIPYIATTIGLPNSGKSSFINMLSRKKNNQTGDLPGVTQTQQWNNVNKNIQLLDTPGILERKIDCHKLAMSLHLVHAIKDDTVSTEESVRFLIQHLREHYCELFLELYKLDLSKVKDFNEVIDFIGNKLQIIKKGGQIDHQQVMYRLKSDFRRGYMKGVSLFIPEHEKFA